MEDIQGFCRSNVIAICFFAIIMIAIIILVIYFAVQNSKNKSENAKKLLLQAQNNMTYIGLNSPIKVWKPRPGEIPQNMTFTGVDVKTTYKGETTVKGTINEGTMSNKTVIYDAPDGNTSPIENILQFNPENYNITYGKFTSPQEIEIILNFNDGKEVKNVRFNISVINYEPSSANIPPKVSNAVKLSHNFDIKTWSVSSNKMCTCLNIGDTYVPNSGGLIYMDSAGTINYGGLTQDSYEITANTSDKGEFVYKINVES